MAKQKKKLVGEGKRYDELTEPEKKAIRSRARKNSKKATEAFHMLYKPVEEWDMDELAKGRPRNQDGSFTGPKPKWISAQVHDEAMKRFEDMLRGHMREISPAAIQVINDLISNTEVVTDDEGQVIRHLVPQSTKLQAATFLLEHLLGKPTARVEGNIALQVQSILAGSLVNPDEDEDIEVDALESGDDDD